MNTQTDYSEEIHELLTGWYTPIEKEEANDDTVKKTLDSLTQDVQNVLPAKWVDAQDVYHGLIKEGFKSFPSKDDTNQFTFLYYLQPK